jgi:hypothetical protein
LGAWILIGRRRTGREGRGIAIGSIIRSVREQVPGTYPPLVGFDIPPLTIFLDLNFASMPIMPFRPPRNSLALASLIGLLKRRTTPALCLNAPLPLPLNFPLGINRGRPLDTQPLPPAPPPPPLLPAHPPLVHPLPLSARLAMLPRAGRRAAAPVLLLLLLLPTPVPALVIFLSPLCSRVTVKSLWAAAADESIRWMEKDECHG